MELNEEYLSLYRDTINIFYWFLPENEENAKQLYPNIKDYLDFIETTIGPYPFRNENGMMLSWLTLDDLPFNMPLEIRTKDGIQKIDFSENIASLNILRDKILEFDPNNWILFTIKE